MVSTFHNSAFKEIEYTVQLDFGFPVISLAEKVKAFPILTLQLMYADIVHWHLGAPYTVVGFMDQCGGHPTLNVATRPLVGLLPFCRKAPSYTFKRSLCLDAKEAIHGHEKVGELKALLEAGL